MRGLVSLAVAGVLVAAPLRAQECNRPDIVDTLPQDDARGVPTNARLLARYEKNAEYLGESILFGKDGEEAVALTGVFNANEGLVEVTPPAPLEPGERYSVEWPALRGIATATLGRGAKVRFTAGSDEARDDGGRDSLALVVFQTAGPGITATSAATPVLTRALPDDNHVALRLLVDEAVGRVCFAAIVRDLGGRVSASGNVEACTKTVAPPFFRGCSVQGARSGGGSSGTWLAAIALLLLRRQLGGVRRGS